MDTIQLFAQVEFKRYREQGHWLWFKVLFWYLLVITLPEFLRGRPWQYIVDSFTPVQIFIFGLAVTQSGWFLVHNLSLFFTYKAKLDFFEKYKIMSDPWPWESNYDEWKRMIWKALALVTFNNLFTYPLGNYAAYYLYKDAPFKYAVEDLPTNPITGILIPLYIMMFIEDTLFFFGHWTAHHNKAIYTKVHKLHHNYKQTIGFVNHYVFPPQVFSLHVSATYLISLLVGVHCHIYVLFLYTFIRELDEVDSHCGYEFPWQPTRLLPLINPASFHDYHHSANKGNYSLYFSFWDIIFGTCKTFYSRVYLKENKSC